MVAFFRAERHGDPGSQPTAAPNLLGSERDRTFFLPGPWFCPLAKEGPPSGFSETTPSARI